MEPQLNPTPPQAIPPQAVQPQKMQTAPPRLWPYIVLGLVLALLAAGGVYYWQNQKVKDLQKEVATLKAENANLKYDLKDLNAGTRFGAVEGGSADQKVIKSRLVEFFRVWDDAANAESIDSRLEAVKAYVTEPAKAQAKKESTTDLFTCSQNSLDMLVVENPAISSNKADVEILPIVDLGLGGRPVNVKATHSFSMVKQGSNWLIDKVTCPPPA